jgi:hypothetical protein
MRASCSASNRGFLPAMVAQFSFRGTWNPTAFGCGYVRVLGMLTSFGVKVPSPT